MTLAMQLDLTLKFLKNLLKTLKYSQDLGSIFPLLLPVGGWVGGMSETGNKANLSLSLS